MTNKIKEMVWNKIKEMVCNECKSKKVDFKVNIGINKHYSENILVDKNGIITYTDKIYYNYKKGKKFLDIFGMKIFSVTLYCQKCENDTIGKIIFKNGYKTEEEDEAFEKTFNRKIIFNDINCGRKTQKEISKIWGH